MVSNTNSLYYSDAANTTYNQYVKTIAAIASGSSLASGDDPADVAVSADLSNQIDQLGAASGDVQGVISLAQTQEGFLQGIQSQLTQLGVVAQQATSNALGPGAQQAYSDEFNSLLTQVDQVAGNASYNGVPLFSGQTIPVSISAGSATDSFVLSTIGTAASLGLSGASVATPADAANAVSLVNSALTCVSNQIASVSADVSKFNFYAGNIATSALNLTSADSSVSDADIAQQSTQLASDTIQNEIVDAVQAQAARSSKYVLSLLAPVTK